MRPQAWKIGIYDDHESVTAEQLSSILEALTVLLRMLLTVGPQRPCHHVCRCGRAMARHCSGPCPGTRVLWSHATITRWCTVQLALRRRPMAQHRAEVQKSWSIPQRVKQGIGQALMTAIEEAARRVGVPSLSWIPVGRCVGTTLPEAGLTLGGSFPTTPAAPRAYWTTRYFFRRCSTATERIV